jgi:tRNA (guanine37-N1)-methyltransferase
MKITFVTLFPNLIEPYFQDSILKRAIDKKLISINFENPRKYSEDGRVDRPLIGGGAGMLLRVDILSKVLEKYRTSHIIALSPVGKRFSQLDAKRLSKMDDILLISGRYEGFDERVLELYVDEVFSIGEYILTGGELASLVVSDAIIRNIPGVLGNSLSLEDESFRDGQGYLEAPNFAKPNEFMNLRVPSVYLSGNHAKVADLKMKMSTCKTKFYNPE